MQEKIITDGHVLDVAGIADARVSWMEPVPAEYRKKRAAIALSIGAALSIVMLATQLLNNATMDLCIFSTIPAFIGVWRFKHWLSLVEIKKYQTVTTTFSKDQRIKAALRWLLFGLAISASLLLGAFKEPSFVGAAILSAATSSIFVFVVYMRREVTVLTEAAKNQLDSDERAQREKSNKWVEQFEYFLKKPSVRYPLSGGLFWFAYYLSNLPKTTTVQLILVAGLAIACCYEVALWIVGIAAMVGIASLAFNGIAALPVSVAIIVGSLIIASAVK